MDTVLIDTLQRRFDKNPNRHLGIMWGDVLKKLEENPTKLASLGNMEETGGEPDVVGLDKTSGNFLFFDCSPESPAGRRSVCYDQAALESRKANKPADSAVNMATEMGVELLTEEQYRELQTLGKFDQKTSSWILTPSDIRALKGALFGDFRYGKTFVYHNGADSYYAARGFRCILSL